MSRDRKIVRRVNSPARFKGSDEERQANYRTHHWIVEGDETPYCGNCDAKIWHAAACYPCGTNVPRVDRVTFSDGTEVDLPPLADAV